MKILKRRCICYDILDILDILDIKDRRREDEEKCKMRRGFCAFRAFRVSRRELMSSKSFLHEAKEKSLSSQSRDLDRTKCLVSTNSSPQKPPPRKPKPHQSPLGSPTAGTLYLKHSSRPSTSPSFFPLFASSFPALPHTFSLLVNLSSHSPPVLARKNSLQAAHAVSKSLPTGARIWVMDCPGAR